MGRRAGGQLGGSWGSVPQLEKGTVATPEVRVDVRGFQLQAVLFWIVQGVGL